MILHLYVFKKSSISPKNVPFNVSLILALVGSYLFSRMHSPHFYMFRDLARPSFVLRQIRFDQLLVLCWLGICLFHNYGAKFFWRILGHYMFPHMDLWTWWFCRGFCPCSYLAQTSIDRFLVSLVFEQAGCRIWSQAPTWLYINCRWMPTTSLIYRLQNLVFWMLANHKRKEQECYAFWLLQIILQSTFVSPFCGIRPCEDGHAVYWYSFRSNSAVLHIVWEELCLCCKFWRCHPTWWASLFF